MSRYRLIYLDTCPPDYFQGHNNKTLIAFCWQGQTIKEVIDSLMLNANNESHEPDVYTALHDFKERWENLSDYNKPVINFKDVEYPEDLVHYFGLVESNENNK